ncbi:hypothetical protein FEF65_10015 [Mariprofundus erugo]|uniref:Fido domain-containing protein n=1 Tax=Mariprofundus erugo TaxID=2528639 RepID=A0A5R9GTA5_9PROT|nr:Fic family protein [Mariprofundus erugo]TLS66494.1 hypothetical protein FEF65_10015 [Mariprofundus erugo]
MESIDPVLFKQFERERASLPEDSLFLGESINITDVLKAYYLIVDYFLATGEGEAVLAGLKDGGLLCSALGRQNVSFGGKKKWKDSLDIGASLFYGMVKNHAFHDGNKRVSLLILLYHLWKAGRIPTCKKKELEQLTVRVAANELASYGRQYLVFSRTEDPEVKFISDFVKRNTRRIDKNYYPLTYREFNARLSTYDCKLDDPSGGFISVYKQVVKTRFLRPSITEWKKVYHIGFSGWTKQIRLKAVKETLKSLELTADKGIDSTVFFKGGEPLSYLIEEFEQPLMRLKDK